MAIVEAHRGGVKVEVVVNGGGGGVLGLGGTWLADNDEVLLPEYLVLGVVVAVVEG